MGRNFWRDLYPMSETRKRLSRSSWVWIYLPIAAGVLIAAGLAITILVSAPGDGFMQGGQLATIILAGGMLIAGFLSWLAILACLWGLGDLARVLPALTTRMRLRFVAGARSWRRAIYAVKRTAAAVMRFFSPDPDKELFRRSPPPRGSSRR
ncbi:MAG: hypothetical protein WBM17_13205 [Anaerolineales bacterium]